MACTRTTTNAQVQSQCCTDGSQKSTANSESRLATHDRQMVALQSNVCLKYLPTLMIVRYGIIVAYQFLGCILSATINLVELPKINHPPVETILRATHLSNARDQSTGSKKQILEDESLIGLKPYDLLSYTKSIIDQQQKQRINLFRFFSTTRKNGETLQRFKSNRLISLGVLILLVYSLNDAPPCYCFGLIEHNNDSADYNNPSKYVTDALLNSQRFSHPPGWHLPRRLYARQINDDPSAIMSTALDSLVLDQSSNESGSPRPTPSHSWTSIFNPFGGNNNNNGNVAPNQKVDSELDKHIREILVPRVSGTQGNVNVRKYIVDVLKRNDYQIELDEFTDSTPVGKVKFANIIASSNPKACRQLVLACHYDSKMMTGFLGATDSAVPCAMLLKIAKKFSDSYRPSSDNTEKDNLGLRFIFFDGEEAYMQWTRTDSLYGSRHLAAKWARQAIPQECSESQKRTELDRIELFVLLDLIGTSDTAFVQYSPSVKRHYEVLQRHERDHIHKMEPVMTQSQVRQESAFKSKTMALDLVEDDHVPFKQRGVPILLLLAHPFPRVWHTVNDNYDAIDFARTQRILHSLEQFVANYS